MVINIATKRPGRPKSDEKRRAIREAAAGIFLEVGWAGTSMDAVARAAGVSKQTVYSHYKSKEDLFRACVTNKLELYELDGSDLADLDLEEALLAYGHRFLTLLNDPDVIRMHRLLISHCTEFPRLVDAFFAAGPEAVYSALARLLSARDTDRFGGELGLNAAHQFFCSLEAPFMMDLLLNRRTQIDVAEMQDCVQNSVRQLLA